MNNPVNWLIGVICWAVAVVLAANILSAGLEISMAAAAGVLLVGHVGIGVPMAMRKLR